MARKTPIPVKIPGAFQKIIADAQALDRRRQAQINNQIAAINRLMAAWQNDAAWTYDDEMAELHRTLAAAHASLAEAGENKEEEMGKRKDAFLAGFAAGETEDDANEAWSEYKAEQDEADGTTEDDTTTE